jgi:hypothetical protein
VQSIKNMTAQEVRHCAMVKFFPQLMYAFTAMHVAFTDGRVSQSSQELRSALADALALGKGDAFFTLVSKITSSPPLFHHLLFYAYHPL